MDESNKNYDNENSNKEYNYIDDINEGNSQQQGKRSKIDEQLVDIDENQENENDDDINNNLVLQDNNNNEDNDDDNDEGDEGKAGTRIMNTLRQVGNLLPVFMKSHPSASSVSEASPRHNHHHDGNEEDELSHLNQVEQDAINHEIQVLTQESTRYRSRYLEHLKVFPVAIFQSDGKYYMDDLRRDEILYETQNDVYELHGDDDRFRTFFKGAVQSRDIRILDYCKL